MAIPKIIHCCWLSGEPYPTLVQMCLNSWKVFLPEYEVVIWNSKKIKEISSTWVDSAIQEKKWAFAADYVRLFALYNYGGVYLDMDVEVLKSFDDLLEREYFLGRESARNVVEAAVLGAEPKATWVKDCLDFYEGKSFEISKINRPEVAIPFIVKKTLKQTHQNVKIYAAEYFSPLNNLTGELRISDNSYCVHHFNGAWFSEYQKRYFEIRRTYSKKYGTFIGFAFANLFALKHKILG